MKNISGIAQATSKILIENPVIVMLFLIVGLVDGIALTLLFLAPDSFVTGLIAPVISRFWDARYLHYPENFILLPKLFQHAHFLITCVIGIVVTGIVIKKIESRIDGKNIAVWDATGIVLKKYVALVVTWVVAYSLFNFIIQNALPILPRHIGIQLGAGYLIGIMIQALFAYLLPALLIQNKGYWKDIWGGLKFGFRYWVPTMLIIAIPMLFVIILSYFKALTPVYVEMLPELVLVVLSIGILVMLIVDIWITSATTVIFLKEKRGTQNEAH